MPELDVPQADDVDGLYVVVPEQFIAARDALVRRLRSDGAKAEAARVAKLRRPPLTAWALNQVARTAPALIEQLFNAGQQLRAAMEQALAGDASGLHPARAEERSAVDAVVAAAVGVMEQDGYAVTDVIRPRMAATLRAAIVDDSVAMPLRQGVLAGDHDAPGFGMDSLAGPALAAAAAPEAEAASTDSPPSDDLQMDEPGAKAAPRRDIDQEARADLARWRAAQEEATRLSGVADRLVAEADHLAAEAERMSIEAQRARQRAIDARSRADAATVEAAGAARRAAAARPVTLD